MFTDKTWSTQTQDRHLPNLDKWHIWRGSKQGTTIDSHALIDMKLDIAYNRQDIDENRQRIELLEERVTELETWRTNTVDPHIAKVDCIIDALHTYMEEMAALGPAGGLAALVGALSAMATQFEASALICENLANDNKKCNDK